MQHLLPTSASIRIFGVGLEASPLSISRVQTRENFIYLEPASADSKDLLVLVVRVGLLPSEKLETRF